MNEKKSSKRKNYQLSEEEINAIKEADKEFENGNYFTTAEVMKEARGWLLKETPLRFSKKELKILDLADKEIDKGNFLTNEEAHKELEEWLKSSNNE